MTAIDARREGTTSSTGWRSRAACRGVPTALFYDVHPDAVAAATAVCAGCSVRQHCAAHAIADGEEFGVWGGLAADDRPAPTPTRPAGPGPAPRISDDDLYDVFIDADPDRPALDQLLEHMWMPTATAYRMLDRAVRLGVVERRGRALFPNRQ